MQQRTVPITFTPVLLVIILMIASLGQVAAEIYVPSLPAITRQFHANSGMIQLTLAIYLFSFSISQLIYGPISDRIGRRKPLLFGIGISVVGSAICFFAPNVLILILGRLIQGFGLGACNSVGRTLSRDLLSGELLARLGSQMGMISSFVVAAAPILGGYIQHYLSWRITFLFIMFYTAIILYLIARKLPETIQQRNPQATQFIVVFKNYFTILRHPVFIGYALCATIAYSGIIAYLTVAPFLLENRVGLTPIEFGWLAFIFAWVMFVSAYVNSSLIVRLGIPRMIRYGVSIMTLAGILMLSFGLMNLVTLFTVLTPMLIFGVGASLTFSNAFAGAFHPFADKAGAASGVYGFLQVAGASFISALLAGTHPDSQIPLGIILTLLGIGAIFAVKFLTTRVD